MSKITVSKFVFSLIALLSLLWSEGQEAQDGVIDITGMDISDPIALDGHWRFYWGELFVEDLPPSDKAQLVDFPVIWNDLAETDYSSEGYATYQLKLVLDPDLDYAIRTPPVYNSYAFYFNGRLLTKNGIVGKDEASAVPQWRMQTKVIPKEILLDTNILTLQISNFRHYRGGPVESVIIGESEQVLAHQDWVLALDALLTGALVMGGLFFLGLYFFGRRQKSIFYFSLFCLAFSYFIFGRDTYLITWLYPGIPWVVAVKLEYAIIYIMAILLVKYIYAAFDEEAPKYFDKVIIGVSLILIFIVLISPAYIFTQLLPAFLVLVLLGIGIGLYVYFRALLRKRAGSGYSFIGISIILVTLGFLSLEHFGLLVLPEFIVPLGYVLFFCFQSITISQQVALAWKSNQREIELALQSKSDFLSIMSHEIRTPMNAVIGLTHHLIDSQPRKDQMESLSTLKFSSENLLRLLNDILDFNKLEAGGIALEENIIDLKSLGDNLTNGFKPMAEEQKTKLAFEYDSKLPAFLMGDEGRLTQVLSNFIGNAIKFTKDGSIVLSMTLVERSAEDISIRFSVKDTGIGISSDDREKIFERFNQANTSISRTYGGTGLGLAISKKILELQNVVIELDTELGKGSDFYFTLPLRIAQDQRTKIIKPSILIDPLKEKRILLVEDNAINVIVAQRFLEKWHCIVDVAGNGQEALDKYEEDKYDLILMDLQMPVMDGYEATKTFRAQGVTLPILALTAAALLDFEKDVKLIGLDDFIIKPFHPDHLHEKLIKFLVKPS